MHAEGNTVNTSKAVSEKLSELSCCASFNSPRLIFLPESVDQMFGNERKDILRISTNSDSLPYCLVCIYLSLLVTIFFLFVLYVFSLISPSSGYCSQVLSLTRTQAMRQGVGGGVIACLIAAYTPTPPSSGWVTSPPTPAVSSDLRKAFQLWSKWTVTRI